jgi:hypothetical protein
MMDSVRALQNDEIGAQEGNFRSLAGGFYRSKNFRKVSMNFWNLSFPDIFVDKVGRPLQVWPDEAPFWCKV